MVNEAELDHIILWVDDSDESQKVRELLSKTGVDYEEKSADQANPDDRIEPPILQTYLYRYSGLTLIQALTQNPYLPFMDHLSLEIEQYLALVRFEEGMRDLSPEGISRLWPPWSKRWKPFDPHLRDA